jgi:uroporphyrinogen decarboxylase
MTQKQRFIEAVVNKRTVDRVASMELEFHIYKDYIGKEPKLGREFSNLSKKEKDIAICENAEIFIETAQKAGWDAMKDVSPYWELFKGEPAYFHIVEEDARLEIIRQIKKRSNDELFVMGTVGATVGIPPSECFEEYITDLYDNPEKIKAQCDYYFQIAMENQKKLIDAGVDGILNSCDVAFNSGPFISPSVMDEFFFPYLNDWVESVKKEGLPTIWHTDGNILPIIDKIIASGLDALQCIDPLAGLDIVALSEIYGNKLTLIGNIDCSNLQLGTKSEIEGEVKRVVENCKNNGGFVLSACNVIFEGINAENYEVMVKAKRKFGQK